MELKHLAHDEVDNPQGWDKLGWGLKQSVNRGEFDTRLMEKAQDERPALFMPRERKTMDPEMEVKWLKFLADKGYDEGSADLSLIEEFVYGQNWHWLPQKTGSCTISNSFRGNVRRILAEIILFGQAEEPLGSTEFGTTSAAYYAPLSYGLARQKANIRSGDGGWCEPTIWSLEQGVIPCNNGQLNEILHRLNADRETDLPEPQDNNVYRRFQNWTYNDQLKPFLVYPLVESVSVKDVDTLDEQMKEYKPVIMCSMIAIRKVGDHDGLAVYAQDPRNQWAHNMCWMGRIVWKGKTYMLLSNESWGKRIVYPIEINEVARMLKSNRGVVCQSLGEHDLENSKIAA